MPTEIVRSRVEKALVAGLRLRETLPEASVPVRVTLRDGGMATETSRGEAEAGDTEIATAKARRPRKLVLKILKNARCSVRSFADTLYLACVVSLYIICWLVCMSFGMGPRFSYYYREGRHNEKGTTMVQLSDIRQALPEETY